MARGPEVPPRAWSPGVTGAQVLYLPLLHGRDRPVFPGFEHASGGLAALLTDLLQEFSESKSQKSYLNTFNELGKCLPPMPGSFRVLAQTTARVQMEYLHSAKV